MIARVANYSGVFLFFCILTDTTLQTDIKASSPFCPKQSQPKKWKANLITSTAATYATSNSPPRSTPPPTTMAKSTRRRWPTCQSPPPTRGQTAICTAAIVRSPSRAPLRCNSTKRAPSTSRRFKMRTRGKDLVTGPTPRDRRPRVRVPAEAPTTILTSDRIRQAPMGVGLVWEGATDQT